MISAVGFQGDFPALRKNSLPAMAWKKPEEQVIVQDFVEGFLSGIPMTKSGVIMGNNITLSSPSEMLVEDRIITIPGIDFALLVTNQGPDFEYSEHRALKDQDPLTDWYLSLISKGRQIVRYSNTISKDRELTGDVSMHSGDDLQLGPYQVQMPGTENPYKGDYHGLLPKGLMLLKVGQPARL